MPVLCVVARLAAAFALAVVTLPSPARAASADAPPFADLDQRIAAGEFGLIRSLLVQRDGELIHEAYYRGAHAEELTLLNSVTKSVGATLVGMAVRRGLLAVDRPLSALLPQYDWNTPPLADSRGLTLAHVLSMRHGLRWDEWSTGFLDSRNSAVQMFASPDWYQFTLNLPRIAASGSGFTYSTGIATLMSGVLRAATQRSPEAIFVEWLAQPLGIASHHWELWSPGGRGTGIRQFPFGDVPLGVGLWLRPRDLAKIGQLYLDGGVHQGRRLLDQEWIDASWTAYSHGDNDGGFRNAPERTGYGYQWWFLEFVDARGRKVACWYANGAGRQYLFVCPLLELVVVSTGNSYDYSGPGLITLLREHILPALAPPVSHRLAGTWYDPASDGQGVNIEVWEQSRTVVATWYTYSDGRPQWYIAQGAFDGDAVSFTQIHRAEGGQFLAGPPPTLHSVGSATLRWIDCHRATLDFQLEQGSGRYALQRLTGECSR